MSNDCATRLLVRVSVGGRVTITARELPLAQPAWFTISWITVWRSGVRWSPPAAPDVQLAGDHGTTAAVRPRDETFCVAVVKVAALPLAWPWTCRVRGVVLPAAAVNCTHERTISAPRGTATPRKRTPMVWMKPS